MNAIIAPISESVTNERVSFTLALCLVAMLVSALAGTLAEGYPIVYVIVSTGLLMSAVALVRATSARRLGTSRTICVLFFSFAAVHAFVGYAVTSLSGEVILISSRADDYYSQALLITALGIFAGAVAYTMTLQKSLAVPLMRRLGRVDDDRVSKVCRALVLCGSLLMVLVYWKLGFASYLAEPAKWPFMRYVTSSAVGGSSKDEWFINRALDSLTIALPLVLLRLVTRRKAVDLFIGSIGCLCLLLPLRRANPLGVVMVLFILIGKRNLYRYVLRAALVLVLLYSATQVLFLWATFGGDSDTHRALVLASSGLPELRDLGLTISLLGQDRLNGATFVQAVIPLPSILSSWSQRHSLRTITTRLIGMDEEGDIGGLRLTLAGEGYINFGYFGVLATGLIWGSAMGWAEKLLHAAREQGGEFAIYVAALVFVLVAFWLYLGGTQAAATMKGGAILTFAIALVGGAFSRQSGASHMGAELLGPATYTRKA